MTVGKPNFSEPVSMEVLKYLFSSANDSKVNELLNNTSGLEELLAQNPVIDSQKLETQKVDSLKSDTPANPNAEKSDLTDESGEADEEQELLQAEAKEISSENSTGKIKIDHVINAPDDDDTTSISKNELVKILEAAVSVIMDNTKEVHANLPQVIHSDNEHAIAPQAAALIEEKNTEINELKTLLVEAQSTIIKLLTDRVEDRSKLATLESQAKFLPDFQKTNAQAMGVAMSAANNDLLLRDLGKVKAEIERLKGSRGQSLETDSGQAGAWAKLRRWLTN